MKIRAEKSLLKPFFQKELLKVSKRSQRNEKGVKKNLSALLNQITNRSMRFVSHQWFRKAKIKDTESSKVYKGLHLIDALTALKQFDKRHDNSDVYWLIY